MAVWQFPLLLIPERWAETNIEHLSFFLADDGWMLEDAWNEHLDANTCLNIADQIIPDSEHRTAWENCANWGNDKSNDISIDHEDNRVLTVRSRLDMRCNIDQAIAITCGLTKSLKCKILVMEKARFIPADTVLLKEHAFGSKAGQYVTDPFEFLNREGDIE